MSRIINVLSIAAILLSLAASTVSASEENEPVSWLWNWKVQFENMRLGIEDKLQGVRAMTQARVEAAARLAEEPLATRLRNSVCVEDCAAGPFQTMTQLQNGVCVEDCATGPFQTMTQLQNGVCGENCATEPLQTRTQAGTGPIGPEGEPPDVQLQGGINNRGPVDNGSPNTNSGGH